MSWSKRQFIIQAFEEMGLASYVFDLSAEQLNSALIRLDSMMAVWNAKGIRIGYPLPSAQSTSDLDAQTNVPDAANEAIYTNLGIRLAPSYGKTVPVETKIVAKMALDALLAIAAVPPQAQFPDTLPLGAGNKTWGRRQIFIGTPTPAIDAGDDSNLEFV